MGTPKKKEKDRSDDKTRPFTRADFHSLLKRAINPPRISKPAAKST
jgi:hypothetical protein